MSRPLLSICIPTYNRAELLRSALWALAPQVQSANGLVEVVVSDNCSPDHTPEVVEWAQQYMPIRYHRKDENIGGIRNVLYIPDHLALGEYCWILGDDDLVRPDGVMRVLSVLQKHPELGCVFVNVSPRWMEIRQQLGRLVTGEDFPELLPTKAKKSEDKYLASWDELIDPQIDDVYLGSLMCCVFRLQTWKQYPLDIDPSDPIYSSLQQTYPHSVVFAHTLRGQNTYFIGYPCIITFFGTQEWLGYLPMIVAVRLQELIDLYQSLGVDKKRVESCRRHLLGNSRKALFKLITDRTLPGRQYFSLSRFIWQNRHHPLALVNLFLQVGKKVITENSASAIKRSPPLHAMLRRLRPARTVAHKYES